MRTISSRPFELLWHMQVPGVVGFYGAGDVPGSNMIGPVLHDEELFATRRVTCVGQARSGAAPMAACCLVNRFTPGHIPIFYLLLTECCGDAPCSTEGMAPAEVLLQNTFAGALTHDMRRTSPALTSHVHAQALGVVVAETEAAARDGAALVAVTYADLPALMSIDDAVDAGSFFEVRRARCGARVRKHLQTC